MQNSINHRHWAVIGSITIIMTLVFVAIGLILNNINSIGNLVHFNNASHDAFKAMMMAEQNEPGTQVTLRDRRLWRDGTLTLTYRWAIEDQQRQLIIEGVQDVDMCRQLALSWWLWMNNRFNKTYSTMTFTLPHHSIRRNVSDIWKDAHDSEYQAKADICYDGKFDVIQLTVSK